MYKLNKIILLTLFIACSFKWAHSQKVHRAADQAQFKKIVSRNIPGAPRLKTPLLLEHDKGPLAAYGMGWAAPMMYDVDRDGLDDLVLGEFGSGLESGTIVGNFLRYYRNIGTKEQPEYDWISNYIRHPTDVGFGTPLSIWVWCCMAFTPRLVDLNGDGLMDLAAGQYHPGEVVWFKGVDGKYGNDKGFAAPVHIPQEGINAKRSFDGKNTPATSDTTNFEYWSYSTVAFVDFNNDGKQDAIFGGDCLRIALNTGTKESPSFGVRTPIRDSQGNLLSILDELNYPDKKKLEDLKKKDFVGTSMVPFIIDWDNDGVEDLLVTGNYVNQGSFLVTFFKGKRTNGILSFEKGQPLFETQNGEKLMPGSWPVLWAGDWNNDGVNDLIIGMSMTTEFGVYDPQLSWRWEVDVKTTKANPGYSTVHSKRAAKEKFSKMESSRIARGLTPQEGFSHALDEYNRLNIGLGRETVAHVGYVYVLLGENK